MDNAARFTGYACVLAILALLGSALGAFHREAKRPARIVQVHFPEIGTLMADDPVVQNGVTVGRVRGLHLGSGLGVAELEFFTRRFLAEDTRFVNFNHSLMGARMVVVVTGKAALPMDEDRIQEGFFSPGVAETVQRVEDLLSLVRLVRVESDHLFKGPKAPLAPAGMHARLEKTLVRLDKISRQAEKAGREIQAGALALTRSSAALRAGLRATEKDLNPMWGRLGSSLASTVAVEKNIEEALVSLEKLVATVRDSSGGLGSHFYNRVAYDEMLAALRLLETALRTLKKDGLADAIEFRRNIHLFREKAR